MYLSLLLVDNFDSAGEARNIVASVGRSNIEVNGGTDSSCGICTK